MKQMITKSGRTFYIPSLEEIQEADHEMGGFCVACGEMAFNVEPDARRYECESCGAPRVYGAQELAIMGYVS